MLSIIGIWDGHDAGVAVVIDGRTVFAANEERYTRRKLEVGFPKLALAEAMEHVPAGAEVHYAITTSDPAKYLTRVFPSLKERYYKLRRRQEYPGPMHQLKRRTKYALTQLAPMRPTISGTLRYFAGQLNVRRDRLILIDHHEAHAAGAAYGASWDGPAVILTLDGIGDGCSGSFWRLRDGIMQRLGTIRGRDSLGLFFEHVTTQLGMRELEDEGKVMALATLASPVPDNDNPFLRWFKLELDDLPRITCSISPLRMAAEVERVAWFWPREQVCYMAQRTLELLVPKIAESVITQVETGNLGYAGGVASNIKVNRLIRTNPRVKRLFVCPHMGDGGLALGAAWAASARRGVVPRPLDHLFLGSGSNGQQDGIDQQVIAALEGHSIPVQRCMDIVANTARLIADGKVVMWYQGAMELGPRALGHRSILARADSTRIKDDLNLRLKRRVWFQPFCPSMLTSEARRLLSDFRGPDENPFMTCGFLVRPEHLATLQGVIGPDGSCRPQMVRDDDRTLYTELLKELKRVTGVGVLLNTSFNLHGEPLVNTVSEAVNTWIRSGVDYLVIEDMLLRKPDLPP